ncbi:MAG: hypothetical protein ACI841_002019 [Planctomycetota bacterium]|jgi:hypothetical protein
MSRTARNPGILLIITASTLLVTFFLALPLAASATAAAAPANGAPASGQEPELKNKDLMSVVIDLADFVEARD